MIYDPANAAAAIDAGSIDYALVVDGEVKVSGKAPASSEIEAMLSHD